MTRPIGTTATQVEPASAAPRLVEARPLPEPFAALRPDREDDRTLWSVWGFDSYFRAANQGFLGLLGWTEAELSSASYWDFVHPDDRHPLVEDLDRTMTASGRLTAYEARLLGRDGYWHRLKWDVVVDPDAELICGVSTPNGIDDCAGRRPRPVVGTWVREGRAGPLLWSDEMYAMYGIPVGTPLTDALMHSRIDPRDLPLVERVRQARLADGDAHGIRLRTVAADGTTRHLECTGRVVSGSGDAITVRGFTIDLTSAFGTGP